MSGGKFDPATLTDRELYEFADGMRHWWNDDNPDEDQRKEYDLLRYGSTATHDRYVLDLEACVAEMYQRWEK